MFKKILKVLLLTLSCLSFPCCTMGNATNSPAPLVLIHSPENTVTPVIESTSTQSQPFPIAPENSVVSYDCSYAREVFSPDPESKYSLLIQEGSNLFILNLSTGEKMLLGQAESGAISPDGTKLAFISLDDHRLVIVDNKLERTGTAFSNVNWYSVVRWMDNENVLIENFRWHGSGLFSLNSQVVLNIVSGDKEELTPDYPGIYDIYTGPGIDWYGYSQSRAVYSPSLKQVVYAAVDEGETPIILWDVQDKKEITRVHMSGNWGDTPQWNSSGTSFITNAPPISKDHLARRLKTQKRIYRI